MAVGVRITHGLTLAQLDALEEALDDGEEAADGWLDLHVPQHLQIVAEELKAVLARLARIHG